MTNSNAHDGNIWPATRLINDRLDETPTAGKRKSNVANSSSELKDLPAISKIPLDASGQDDYCWIFSWIFCRGSEPRWAGPRSDTVRSRLHQTKVPHMKKRRNNSAHASVLQITLLVALLFVSAILFASTFKAAAPAAGRSQSGIVRQDGFYPPLPVPAVIEQTMTVSLPAVILDNSVSMDTVILEPITTSNIKADQNIVGFQGDFTFDSAVLTFSPSLFVEPAGLTGNNWNVSANILNNGQGTMKTLRISAFSNDQVPLSGSGTLFNLRMLRVSNMPGAVSPLVWKLDPDNFLYIDADLTLFSVDQPDGLVTIKGIPPPVPPGSRIPGQR
jgi:hypothetical protein